MSLKNVQCNKYSLDTTKDDVVGEFYIPCLKEAVVYKRSVAYFSSSILLELSKGLGSLADRGGKMQLLISPNLSPEDYQAIVKGYDARESLRDFIVKSFEEDFNNDYDQKELRYEMLSYMIATGLLDIKIVLVTNPKSDEIGLYHPKVGIFFDDDNNRIMFFGSINDSYNAVNVNDDKIQIFRSWTNPENQDRINEQEFDFEATWDGVSENLITIPFPEVIREKILSYTPKPDQQFADIDLEYIEKYKKQNQPNVPKVPEEIHLRNHQIEAYKNWKYQNYRGVFAMATGSGKTFAACNSIVELYNELKGKKRGLVVYICCPQKHLVDQWCEELTKFNIQAVKYHSEAPNYNEIKRNTKLFHQKMKDFYCVVTTNESFRKNEIQDLVVQNLSSTLIIVDEAHNFGATKISEVMEKDYPYRLGLSATFDRHHDSKGTKKIKDFFGDTCIEYTLEQAIKDGNLCPYKYYPVVVALMPDEYEEYMEITKKVPKQLGNTSDDLSESAKQLLIKRARLVGGAIEKIASLKDVLLDKGYINEHNMLIYCSDYKYANNIYVGRQIDVVSNMLNFKLDMDTAKFTAEENMEDRHWIINSFEKQTIQAIVAIKCLDEGIDIPAIKTAFILASTTNPREYIQRRGRVLRNYEGKKYAEIYDFVTLPYPQGSRHNATNPNYRAEQGLAKREIERVKEFAKHSSNPKDSYEIIREITDEYKLDTITEEEY